MSQSLKMSVKKNMSKSKNELFIFLGGHNFWEGLFDTVNVRFIRNLFEFELTNISNVLMTTIIPKNTSAERYKILTKKEESLARILDEYGVSVEFFHIRGRTIGGLLNASKEICQIVMDYDKRLIWAKNYFNCFIGGRVKKEVPGTYLHFDMMGLVPEEEFYYSGSGFVYRLAKFVVLRILGRVNLKQADSVSVVSRQFKEYVVGKYSLRADRVDVIPCMLDPNLFFQNADLRQQYRQKYQIENHHKLIFYSGMLQKWQEPDLLFAFLKKVQIQDEDNVFRFMILTFDQEKARHYANKYGLRDLIIDSASEKDLNGVYNAADIGVATRSADLVSKVSSPLKIPEYLVTKNCVVLLESIGDFGFDLKRKNYALVKENKTDLLNTSIEEINLLIKPTDADIEEIQKKHSILENTEAIKKIITYSYEK